MDKQLAIRRTRIAVSVFFGVLTVAVILLWIRSHASMDYLNGNDGTFTRIGINNGYVFFYRTRGSTSRMRGWEFGRTQAHGELPRFEWDRRVDGYKGTVHFWFVALGAATATVLPWASYRFGLRGLFVLTTLVAVVLGLGVWLAR